MGAASRSRWFTDREWTPRRGDSLCRVYLNPAVSSSMTAAATHVVHVRRRGAASNRTATTSPRCCERSSSCRRMWSRARSEERSPCAWLCPTSRTCRLIKKLGSYLQGRRDDGTRSLELRRDGPTENDDGLRQRLLCSLADQPPLELPERGEHVRHRLRKQATHDGPASREGNRRRLKDAVARGNGRRRSKQHVAHLGMRFSISAASASESVDVRRTGGS